MPLRSIFSANCRRPQAVVLEQLRRVASYTTLCGAVALAILLGGATPAQAGTTTVYMEFSDTASSTTQFTVSNLPASSVCTYSFGGGSTAGSVLAESSSGSCNTNDFLNGGNTIRVQPLFDSPIKTNYDYTGKIIVGSDIYAISVFQWNGTKYTGGLNQPMVYSSGFNNTQNTRFTSFQLLGTSTITANVSYYLDPTEIDRTKTQFNPTAVKFEYSLRPTTNSTSSIQNIASSTGTGTVSTTFPSLADGTYDVLVTFYNFGAVFNGTERPFVNSYVYSSFVISGGVLTTTGDVEYYDSLTPPIDSIYQQCGITNIGGCIVNAFAYLFIPSAYTTEDIFTAEEELATKMPFVYFYEVPELWNTLYNSAQTQSMTVGVTTTIGYFAFISESQLNGIPLATTIRTIIGYLLWIMLAMYMYTEVRKLFNHQPAV